MRFVDEPTEVEAGLNADGLPLPRTFTWRGRRLAITDLGRRWEEESESGLERHFLVMIASGDRFELVYRASNRSWRVVRTWEHLSLV